MCWTGCRSMVLEKSQLLAMRLEQLACSCMAFVGSTGRIGTDCSSSC